MAQQSSRLHRLLTLLDTGSTQATRFAAANQIGDIAKSHPHDLNSLLKKVSIYLRSKNWDTRVAAAHAVGAIAQNVVHTSLHELFACVEGEMSAAEISGSSEDVITSWTISQPNIVAGLSFRSFDICKVLDFGALLASGGQEYDIGNDGSRTPAERLARQKHNLRRRLGLDGCEQFMDVNDMIKDEDLLNKFSSHENGAGHRSYIFQHGNQIQQLVANMVPTFVSKRPSARELNLLKRKARKDQTKSWPDDGELEAPQSQIPKATTPDPVSANKMFMDAVLDDAFDYDGDGRWPFQSFVEQLIVDMFDPNWEVRHGSMMALREIITHQGGSAGVFMLDLSLGNVKLVEIEEKQNQKNLKREREIDLNVQVPGEENESNWKKRKFEDVPCPNLNALDSLNNENISSAYIKTEDGLCGLCPMQASCWPDLETTEVKPKEYLDNDVFHSEEVGDTVEKNNCENESSDLKSDILKSISENCKLMNLVKLTRHSWMKNWEFLQDCAIRFLCVLSLDRFGDYVSDQVVAPVRETCAQGLGAALKFMHPSLVHETLKILLQMQSRSEWEIRHGSLLGIKYLVAVRQDMLKDLLDSILPACKAGLEDPDDDVRAVAADALIPAAASIVSLNGQILHSIVMLLWDILLDLDDLSPSTSSFIFIVEKKGWASETRGI